MSIVADYKLVKRPYPLDAIKGPYVKVILSGPKERLPVIALVDSGADTCAIPEGLAEVLGLDLSAIEEPIVGLGGKLSAIRGKFSLVLEGSHEKHSLHDLPVNVLVGTGDDFPAILGRAGFFEAFEITFKEKEQKTVFKKVPN